MSRSANTASPIEPEFKHTPKLSVIQGAKDIDILDRKEFGKPIRQHVYDFTIILISFFLIVANVKLWRGAELFATPLYWIIASAALFIAYSISPKSLIPLWKVWLKLGAFLEVTTSYLILGGMWVFLFIPIALLLKLIGKKTLSTGFKQPKASYWEERDVARDDMKSLERQF